MLEVKGQHSRPLKQAKLLTASVALKNTQHRREGGCVTTEIDVDFQWILQLSWIKDINVNVICIIFKKKKKRTKMPLRHNCNLLLFAR